jgi:hypothetical protein
MIAIPLGGATPALADIPIVPHPREVETHSPPETCAKKNVAGDGQGDEWHDEEDEHVLCDRENLEALLHALFHGDGHLGTEIGEIFCGSLKQVFIF